MREKFRQFMIGRYGTDELSRFTMGCALVSVLIYMFLRLTGFYYFGILMLFYSYYRIFSRNHNKRYQENLKYQELRDRIGEFLPGRTRQHRDRTHRIYSCPSCKQKVRVPRGKGKISITCPRCRREFIKRT